MYRSGGTAVTNLEIWRCEECSASGKESPGTTLKRDVWRVVGVNSFPPFLRLSYLQASMPVGTRKSNADAHPGRIVLENQRVRRSKEQIEDDITSAKAAATAASEEEAARNRSIAELEDAMERTEGELRTHANRPNLRYRIEPSPDTE